MITMVGHDRTFEVPRSVREMATSASVSHPLVRRLTLGRVTAWDMLQPVMSRIPGARAWADKTLNGLVASSLTAATEAIGCTDCEDTGFYGLPSPADDDMLIALVKREGQHFTELQADGSWAEHSVQERPLEVLALDLAQDLASAILAGASGLVRRYCTPIAFIPPTAMLAALPEDQAQAPASTPAGGWFTYAVVDELDTGAVLNVIRMKQGPTLERYDGQGKWVPDSALLAQLQGVNPPPLVELSEEQIPDVLSQVDASGQQAAVDTEGNAKPPQEEEAATAAGLVADAPLTVSPDPRAEKLRRYWSSGKGAAKIRWNTPGDFKRCVRHLRKYMPGRAEGYCQNLHKRNTGVWTGSKFNVGRIPRHASGAPISLEESLLAALNAGSWAGLSNERATDMTGIKDGIYEEKTEELGVIKSLVAGAFPVKPPSDWFSNPNLDRPTALTVEDSGRVYGHLADFETRHIGLPGAVHAPKSRSNYAYFLTGMLATADGKRVPVGQLTLAGGHAPLRADAAAAVAHYDNTASAIADVTMGEDRYGIWYAGALRPEATPEKVRAFMASALSGDWRPINGHLELVAACSVNVPGFPITRARVASGAIMALTAAGARGIAEIALQERADAGLAARVAALEAAFDSVQVEVEGDTDDAQAPTQEPGAETPSEDPAAPSERVESLRAERRAARIEALRGRVHSKPVETIAVKDPIQVPVAVAADAGSAVPKA